MMKLNRCDEADHAGFLTVLRICVLSDEPLEVIPINFFKKLVIMCIVGCRKKMEYVGMCSEMEDTGDGDHSMKR